MIWYKIILGHMGGNKVSLENYFNKILLKINDSCCMTLFKSKIEGEEEVYYLSISCALRNAFMLYFSAYKPLPCTAPDLEDVKIITGNDTLEVKR